MGEPLPSATYLLDQGKKCVVLGRGCCYGFLALLETFAAENRSALGRLERHCRFFSAIRTIRSRLNLCVRGPWRKTENLGALAFAGFASLRFVLELFIVKEQLFPSRKNEILAAVDTL